MSHFEDALALLRQGDAQALEVVEKVKVSGDPTVALNGVVGIVVTALNAHTHALLAIAERLPDPHEEAK